MAVKGLTVVLADDYEEDDIKGLISAIKMLKGVIDVDFNPVSINDFINRSRIKEELQNKLFAVIDDNNI